MTTYETIIYQNIDRTGLVTLNRPEQLNAINNKMREELLILLDELTWDERVSLIVLTGGEKFFSAGADLKEVATLKDLWGTITFLRKMRTLFDKIEQFPKPTVAALAGVTVAGGLELALACDLRVASENARLGDAHINVGLIPGGGGSVKLPRLIGKGKAMEIILTGTTVDAREAKSLGLVNWVVPEGSLVVETLKITTELTKKPALSLQLAKQAVKVGAEADLPDALQFEVNAAALVSLTEDTREGIAAFLEKRKPEYKHK